MDKNCERCGTFLKNATGRQKYCKACAKDAQREKIRAYDKRRRKLCRVLKVSQRKLSELDQALFELKGYDGLAAAVVIQAAEDWRRLCKGATPTNDCNFIELSVFFEGIAKIYLHGTNMSAEKIYKILLEEKANSSYLNERKDAIKKAGA